VLTAGLLLTAGCTAQPAEPADAAAAPPSMPFAGCAALTAPPGAAPPTTAPSTTAPSTTAPSTTAPSTTAPAEAPVAGGPSAGTAPGGGDATGLPDLTLPCFADGRPIRLTDLRGPAVVNLWASNCGPCREELPAVQRLAERTTDRLHVIGVDTFDTRDAAGSFGADLGITIPNLYDRERQLLLALGRRALPATVLVDAAGRTHVYNGRPLDDAGLATLVTRHTGVTVTP
jgi:thiol-disulfide isomerase/thioredoxin